MPVTPKFAPFPPTHSGGLSSSTRLAERGTFKIYSGNKHAQTIIHDNRIAKISISDFKVFKTI